MTAQLELNRHIKVQNNEHLSILQKMEKDMLLMGRVTMPNMFAVKSPQFHVEMADICLNKANRKICFIAPRGHAKSSLIACLRVVHHIMFTPGAKVVVLISKTESHAIRLLQTIKNVFEFSLPFRSVFGYWGEHSAVSWQKTETVLKDGTLIVCKGAGQQVIGLKHGDQRPTLIVLDDPEDMENTKTAEAMDQNLKWLLQEVVPSRDPLRSQIILIGTVQHERCMVLTLHGSDGWTSRLWRATQPDGSVLWPEWMSKDMLEKEKAAYDSIGRVSSYYREYENLIVGDEDQLFKQKYFKYYRGKLVFIAGKHFLELTMKDGEEYEKAKLIPVAIFVGIDPASSVSQTADYSTIVPVAVDEQRNRYILPYERCRVTPMGLAEKILEVDDRLKPNKTRIESAGYQEMLREYLRSKRAIPGLEIKESPRTSKSRRLETLQPFFVQGQVFMLENMKELQDELLMYPRGKHDDLLDGLFYAMRGNYSPSHTMQDLMDVNDFNINQNGSSWLMAN